jgi:hypothetical protein
VIVRVGGRTLADRPLRGRRFELHVALPALETSVQVVTVDRAGRRSRTAVGHVLGMPPPARPQLRRPVADALLGREIRSLAASFGTASSIYVLNLTTGAGAAWNARASFPAASTLKLPIAVAALSDAGGTPPFGSRLDRLLRQMLIYSDNAAANATEQHLGGSVHGGSARVDALMLSVGLVDTEMYGGYELDAVGSAARGLASSIPLRVESQPSWGPGKRTSAFDLASILRDVWLASGGLGPLVSAQPGFTAADARYLLYLLAHVRDPGKLDRIVGRLPGVRVLHKAGWINAARHDNGVVVWDGGVAVVTVMTYRPEGAGNESDVLAGRAAAVSLRRFRG